MVGQQIDVSIDLVLRIPEQPDSQSEHTMKLRNGINKIHALTHENMKFETACRKFSYNHLV